MSALLQFEDFSAPAPPPAQRYTAKDLAAEYERGVNDGEARAQEKGISDLGDAVTAALTAARNEAEIRKQAVAETLEALTPVMKALVSQLVTFQEDRLTERLLAEIEALCLAGISPVCRISSGAELIARLADRIDALGLQGVTLLPGDRTEITFGNGCITLELETITRQIQEILTEITTNAEE